MEGMEQAKMIMQITAIGLILLIIRGALASLFFYIKNSQSIICLLA